MNKTRKVEMTAHSGKNRLSSKDPSRIQTSLIHKISRGVMFLGFIGLLATIVGYAYATSICPNSAAGCGAMPIYYGRLLVWNGWDGGVVWYGFVLTMLGVPAGIISVMSKPY